MAAGQKKKKKVTDLLSRIYKDRSSPGGYAGIDALHKEANRLLENGVVKRKDVIDFLEGQRTYGLFKPRRLRFPRSRTFAVGYFSDAQADLAGQLYLILGDYTYFFRFSKYS